MNIISPPDGWKEHTIYIVKASHHKYNPVHFALLHVGFLNKDKTPGAYSKVWQNSYDEPYDITELYSVEYVKELCKI